MTNVTRILLNLEVKLRGILLVKGNTALCAVSNNQLKEEEVMFKRKRDFAVVGGILSIIFTFLFVGLAYAVCPGVVCVDQPSSGGTLNAGSTFPIELTFNRTATPASQFRLYVRCGGSPWQIITIRQCDYYGICPPKYYWEIPLVGTTKTNCEIGVRVLNKNFGELGRVASGAFTIEPSFGSPTPLSLAPPSKVVGPAPAGAAQYSISGGRAPYQVGTNNDAIIKINGSSSLPITIQAPVAFTVTNTLSAPCSDTTVTVGVRDADNKQATATYIIDCP